jgi:hypothetical protein
MTERNLKRCQKLPVEIIGFRMAANKAFELVATWVIADRTLKTVLKK